MIEYNMKSEYQGREDGASVFLYRAVEYFKQRKKVTGWNVYASHACFYVLLSSVPLAMLLLMLAGKIIPGRVEGILLAAKDRLPPQVAEYLPEEFVKNAVGADFPIVSATALLMLWSSTKGMRAVAQGLHSVYGTGGGYSLTKEYLLSVLYTLSLVLLLILSLGVLVFGQTIVDAAVQRDGDHRTLLRLLIRLGRIVSFLMFVLIFALIYRFMSGSKLPLLRHFPGALFAAVGWLLYSALFSLYLSTFNPAKYLLYGSLGAVMILMLWSRACMSMLMLGGEVNVLLAQRPLFIGPFRGGDRGG